MVNEFVFLHNQAVGRGYSKKVSQAMARAIQGCGSVRANCVQNSRMCQPQKAESGAF